VKLDFLWEAPAVLTAGFFLLRIIGKKAVGQLTGIEVVTLLATASMIGHAVAGGGLWETVSVLCLFAALLITVQFLALKFDTVERWMMGRACVVVQDGQIIPGNLKKMRMTVDQLEAKLREKGISSFADLKTATIEMSGELGYELTREAKPVTLRELESLLAGLTKRQAEAASGGAQSSLFEEVANRGHKQNIPTKLN
jgi:uncharacterized membrane protein YcaP (DUF421 family)